MQQRVRLGISSCLLGNAVRWNAGHKLDRFLTDTLGQFVDYVPVCPEVEAGFGIPRESFRLVGDPQNPRLMTFKTKMDHTDRMLRWAAKRVKELEKEDLCGFIFKSDSPSSGMIRVKVYTEKGMPEKKGIGMFARAFMEHFPLIPAEDDGRLHDPKIRENFIERIFTLQRWRQTIAGAKSMSGLVDFHTDHKLQLMAHNQSLSRDMGALVARSSSMNRQVLFKSYEELLLRNLKSRATARRNSNALQHMGPCDDPTIRVSVETEPDRHVITVADKGRGIPSEDLERIFEVFHSKGGKSRETQSTGIGLAIVRKIAEIHGGTAWAESAPGQGARFHVSLPRS